MAMYSGYKKDEYIKNPKLRDFAELIMDVTSGHDHDGSNSKAVSVGTVSDLAVTNAKLATDVKVGSVAALTTTSKASVVGAINELDAEIGTISGLSTTAKSTIVEAINEVDAHADAAAASQAGMVTLTGTQNLTNKTLTLPKIDDGDADVTITSADQTHGSATVTIPDIGDAADTFVMNDTQATLTLKTLTAPVITSPNFPDDTVVTLGTTTATAATKITAEFDATTTGIGLINIGSTAVPQVLNANPGATVIAETKNILHSAGAGDCDDCIASYKKIAVTGSGDSGLTIVGDAPRTYVGVTGGANNSVASAAYASQPWCKHEGTGAITAMSALSALVDVNADNFTASTVNAGHFHVEGAATVTGQFDGAMIEVYPDVTSLDAGLAIVADAGATVTSAIRVAGTFGCLMSLPNGAKIFTGTAADENAVYAEVGTVDSTGSVYLSTSGIYFQVANNGADADWNKVTTTHT